MAAFLAWAKANDIPVQSVSIGSCSVTLAASRPQVDRPRPQADGRMTMYEQYGGEAYQELLRSMGLSGDSMTALNTADGLEPALGGAR
jgi:hypothetical protein